MAHTRNFSSPSLLDSFTSPEAMLSPIQSYFGSDPNSPASSFSLPRHEQYLEAPGPTASMDGYHGFATHPWSEQSTTPSRALSHRWTRRLSHPDSLPSRNRPDERMVSDSGSTFVHPASMFAGPSLVAAMMNAPSWQEHGVAPDAQLQSPTTFSDDNYHAQAESSTAEEAQDSENDRVMEDAFESAYGEHYDYNHNLRNSDDDEDGIDDEECYPYGFQAASLELPSEDDCHTESIYEETETEEDETQGFTEAIDEDDPNPTHPTDDMLDALEDEEQDDPYSMSLSDGGQDETEEESDMTHILGFRGRRQNGNVHSIAVVRHELAQDHDTTQSSSSPAMPPVDIQLPSQHHQDREGAESDESLARRLQEEEFSALMGERPISLNRSHYPPRHSHPAMNADRLSRHGQEAMTPSDFREGSIALEDYHAGVMRPSEYRSALMRLSDYRERSTIPSRSTISSSRGRYRFVSEGPLGERRQYLARNLSPSPRWNNRDGMRPGVISGGSGNGSSSSSNGLALRPFMGSSGSRTVTNPDPYVTPTTNSLSSFGNNNSSRHPRTTVRRSRSPPSRSMSSSLAAEGLYLRQEIRTLTRALEHETRMLARYNRRSHGMMGTMWGNPEDYLNDDQVDDSYEGLLRLGEQIGDVKPKGIPMHTLRKMDKHVFTWTSKRQQGMQRPRSQCASGKNTGLSNGSCSGSGRSSPTKPVCESPEENCTICLDAYEVLDRLRPLPCKHAFHVDCIDTWLRNNAQCPICRQEVSAKSVESMPGSSGIP
ncbi:hypothetical protein BGZ83_011315 [Gryganskiella cystojenkinii]|nr:hypothetical protein BGZ83_011315 [Gryganskiella cystojenkinii]